MAISEEAINEAVKKARESTHKRNFLESIDMIINVQDLDLTNPKNRFDLEVRLPHPTSKQVAICVIAEGDLAVRAQRAGADLLFGREDLEKLASNPKKLKNITETVDFFIAAAPLMPLVGRFLGRMLGPRGKMPKPIPPNADIEPIITHLRRSTRLRLRKTPTIHTRVGTVDMKDEELNANIDVVLKNLVERFERGEQNIRSVYIKTTMGKPIKIR
ncbi:MAG: 50S ribosomal protein L1 [Candidatus Heimdallarchaeota archaeon]